MDLLEQPLEAVAFRLYSLPEAAAAGAAAWTCLAAVLAAAAAAGIWRLRAATPAAMISGDTSFGEDRLGRDTSSSAAAGAATAGRGGGGGRGGEPLASSSPSPKERYTAYYRDSCCVGCCDLDDEEVVEEEEEEEEDDDDCGMDGPPSETMPFEWEIVRSLPLSPTASAEVCRYRDTAPLGGSVVRLWDQAAGGSLTAASPRRRGRPGGVVPAF
uniref:Uncharacterized protein n=1 Tax=Oryza brachyantha TaxID=4533 RepID=J3MC25_ORYBR